MSNTTLYLIYLLPLLFSCTLSKSQYSYTFSTTVFPPSSSYKPYYQLGNIDQNSNIRITFTTPESTGGPGQFRMAQQNFIVESVFTGSRLSCQYVALDGSLGGKGQIYCNIPTTSQYRLRFEFENVPRDFPEIVMQYFYFGVQFYNSGGTLIKSINGTQVVRDKITRLIYVNANTDSFTFSLSPGSFQSSTSRTISLYPYNVRKSNQNFYASSIQNLLSNPSQPGSYTINLPKGFYILVVKANDVMSSLSLSFDSDPYTCPYDSKYIDNNLNFQPCVPADKKDDGPPPCTKYNAVNKSCGECRAPYQLINGDCQINKTCPPRQYNSNGICLPVSELCGIFDPNTGKCITCINPQQYDLINGICYSKPVSCNPGFYFDGTICRPIPQNCQTFDYNAKNCTKCFPGFALTSDGRCVRIPCAPGYIRAQNGIDCIILQCPAGQWNDNGVCRPCPNRQYPAPNGLGCLDVSPLCRTYDPVTGNCTSCYTGYNLTRQGKCQIFKCGPREWNSNGTCWPVDQLCDQFDPNTGKCITCKNPQQYEVRNGQCLPRVICSALQHNVNGQCIDFPGGCARHNRTTNICSLCLPNYNLTQYGVCIPICNPGFYYDGFGCSKMPPNCEKVNETLRQCMICKPGFTKTFNGDCVCPEGMIPAQAPGQGCIKVSPLCRTYNPATGNCTSCYPGYNLTREGICLVVQCGPREWGSDGNCWPVNQLCDQFDPKTGRCITCKNFQLYEVINGQCVPNNVTCRPRQYKMNNRCFDNPEGCLRYNVSVGVCTECLFNYTLNSLGICISRCDPGFYYDGKGCLPFNEDCIQFNPQTHRCMKCAQGYNLTSTFTCVKSCPNGTVASSTGQGCIQVSPLCRTYEPIQGNCTSCYESYFLRGAVCCQPGQWNSRGKCQDCPNRQYPSQRSQECLAVSPLCMTYDRHTGNCTSCYQGYENIRGVCQVISCTSQQWNDNGVCRPLPANCSKVDSGGQCTACTSPRLVVVQGRCTVPTPCPAGQYYHPNGVCVNLPSNCALANPTSGGCVQCIQGYIMSAGQCCPNGTSYFNGRCSTSAQLSNQFSDPSLAGQCVAFNPTLGTCLQCNPGYVVDTTTYRTCIRSNVMV